MSNTLSLRATTKIRNDLLISKREELKLSQKDAAKLCGVPFNRYCDYEKLVFPSYYNEEDVDKISGTFDIPKDKIFPTSLIGVEIQNTVVKRREVEVDRLLEYRNTQNKFLLKSAEEVASEKDDVDLMKMYLDKLTYREREVVNLRYGLDGKPPLTLSEIAKIFKVTQERVRMVEGHAISKLKDIHFKNRDTNIFIREYKDKISL